MENRREDKATVHGPVGARVARNINRRRDELKMSQRELALKVRQLNGAVPEAGSDPDVRSTINTISKTEKRNRRVDVDDLTVLAVALKTTPNWLMYHEEPVSATAPMRIYGLQTLRQEAVLNWANGNKPLNWDGATATEGSFRFRQKQRPFEPNHLPREMPKRFEETEQFAILKRAVDELTAAGVERDLIAPLMDDVVKRTAEGWADAEELLRQVMEGEDGDDE